MCIAFPMQVISCNEVSARCSRPNREVEVDITMIEPPKPGEWLLVFQDRALRPITEEEARDIEAALGATALAMMGEAGEDDIRAGFSDLVDREPELPPHLRALVGKPLK